MMSFSRLSFCFAVSFIFIFLTACKTPQTLIVPNASKGDVLGVFMDYVFLNGYRILDQDEERGLYLVYVASQHVNEQELSTQVNQRNLSAEQDIDPMGPPYLGPDFNSYPFYNQSNTDNVTYKRQAVSQRNDLKNRVVTIEEKEEFGVKIVQVGSDVRISMNSISEIYLNPGKYIYGFVEALKSNGFAVVVK